MHKYLVKVKGSLVKRMAENMTEMGLGFLLGKEFPTLSHSDGFPTI